MRLLRASVLVMILLGAAALLSADPIDPGVIFNKGGNLSADIICTTNGCITTVGTVGSNGGATFDVKNDTNKDIIELLFTIPTDNFFQTFFASTNLFNDAVIFLLVDDDLTQVQFFGTGLDTNGTATAGPPVDSCDESCSPGFEPGGKITVGAVFGTSGGSDHPGLLPGQEGVLTLEPTIPEPGTFGLLLTAAGLLVGGRKLSARRTKG